MRLSRLKLILIAIAISLTTSGCNIFSENPVKVNAGQSAELAENVRVKCWVTNKETGKLERRTVDTAKNPGVWLIGREREKADAK